MAGPVQIFPAGLLGLLQLKTLGRNPTDMVENYQPSWDVLEWLLASQSIEHSTIGQISITASGFAAFSPNNLQVPEGEWWWLHDVSLFCTAVTGGDALNAALLWSNPVGVRRQHLLIDAVDAPVDLSDWGSIRAGALRWLPPNAQLYLWVNSFAGNPTATCYVRYTRLPI